MTVLGKIFVTVRVMSAIAAPLILYFIPEQPWIAVAACLTVVVVLMLEAIWLKPPHGAGVK